MDAELARRLLERRKRRLADEARRAAEQRALDAGRVHAETEATVAQERAAAEEKARRETDRARIEALTTELRGFYHPKQAGFCRSRARRRATKKTRRSGATAGGCRELIARALEIPRFRAVYITDTRVNAEARAWRNDTASGFVDVIERYGERLKSAGVPRFDLGSVIAEIRDGDLAIEFSNGSLIELYGANDEGKIMNLRGRALHVYWVDEAQGVRWLERMYKAVITGGMNDFGGECWLTGTPGADLAGLFYDVTRDDGEESQGWEVHHLVVTDNPFFGRVVWELGEWFVEDNLYNAPASDRTTHAWDGAIAIASEAHRWGPFRDEATATDAAIRVRWERGAAQTIRDNGWDEEDPDVLREWKAMWVKEGARLVYAAHSRTEHELCYAPMRLGEDGSPDIAAALRDLPGWKEQREYLLGVGADLGTTRAFAWTMVAWSLVDPILYEVASWKRAGLDYDEMAAVLRSVQAQARVGLWVADAGGGGKAAVKGWSRQWMDRYQLPILEAQKPNKIMAQRQLNTDIRKGHFLLRHGSPLLAEWRTHRWLPMRNADGKLVEDPATHRDLCFIAGTMIETAEGPRPIEALAVGDMVWTRHGLRPVEAAWCSGVRPVWRLTSDAGDLVGTGDHPIWTDGGWRPLSQLTTADILTAWASTDHPKCARSAAVDTDATHSRPSWPRRGISLMDRVGRFIAKSGRRLTGGSHPAITSTTRTRTPATTSSATSGASRAARISAPTCERRSGWSCLAAPSETLRRQPLHGIDRPRVARGTRSTVAGSWQIVLCMITCAWSAAMRIGRRLRPPTSAAWHVTRDADARAASTTPIAPARSAAPSTAATNTRAPSTAPGRVQRVQPIGVDMLVYNLTVAHDHEYFADGVLVSNCDGALYIHRESYHHRYRTPPAKVVTGTPEWVTREETELFDASQEAYGR